MVKLTPEVIAQAQQYTNAVRDRELDLRGLKIPVIENLGSTLDQFDTIDLSDNDIRKIDGFPLLRRLKCLLLNNNRITRIAEHLETNLPNLQSIILTNNNIQELGDIDTLSALTNLTTLSLMRNPISGRQHYRLYVIHRLPQLRLLDFQKIKQKEIEAAANLFKGKKGTQLAKDLGKKTKTFVPGAGLPSALGKPEDVVPLGAPPKPDIEAIKAAIGAATTLEEVERLNKMLQSGLIPGRELIAKNGIEPADKHENGIQEVEDEEEMET